MDLLRVGRNWTFGILLLVIVAACAPVGEQPQAQAPDAPAAQSSLKVVAVESFLADIAQNVAGDRARVDALMPVGVDPHSFEPTPQDVRKVADSDVLILNGAGFEEFLKNLLRDAGAPKTVIEASAGLTSRTLKPGEPHDPDNPLDPHYWLDPINVIRYVENIRDGLAQADPAGSEVYRANAEAYIAQLNALDQSIHALVDTIPAENRKLVTDHDTFGYFADRYGFEIVGMLVPSFTTADATSAQLLAQLIQQVRTSGAKAIFLEQNMNPQVAEQVANDTGVKLVTGLYTHSLSAPDGPAPTYLKMMEYDAQAIVQALK